MAATSAKRAWVPVLTVAAALVIGSACGPSATKPDTSTTLKGPLSSNGRWLTDASGRVVLLHGFNQVSKLAPYYPAAFGFDDDDAAFLADNGFNVVRVGVVPEGLMPAPGAVDAAYIEHLAQTVDSLARHSMFVLLDFHQDGYAPMFNGNGFPDWMALTDGEPNPKDAVFPLYYVQNPAMQRAFDHFWANSPGPDGVGLQDAFMKGFDAVVQRFAGNPWVLGYEPINEPWPGSDWVRCTTAPGCPDLEMTLLKPFYQRALDIVRQHDNRQFLFVEPFVLFNFGKAMTSVPAIAGPQVALSFHSYALDIAGEQGVVRNALAAAEAQDVPLLATEFGATQDPATLDRLAGQLDGAILPWIEWAYNGMVADAMKPAGLDNLKNGEAFTALVRPYPLLVNGTPESLSFDPSSAQLQFTYSTMTPDGRPAAAGLMTVVSVPGLRYPHGYTTTVEGADVVSAPCAPALVLRNRKGTAGVTVRIAPASECRSGS